MYDNEAPEKKRKTGRVDMFGATKPTDRTVYHMLPS